MTFRAEKFILFYLGTEQYALPVLSANQFIEFEKIALVPSTDITIKGLIYHNGNIITIIDIKEKIKIKKSNVNNSSMCLTFEVDGYYYGLLVDRGGKTLEIKKTFNDRQKKVFKKYFRSKDKKKIYILEVDDILSQANIYD